MWSFVLCTSSCGSILEELQQKLNPSTAVTTQVAAAELQLQAVCSDLTDRLHKVTSNIRHVASNTCIHESSIFFFLRVDAIQPPN